MCIVDHIRGAQATLARRGQSDRADGEEFVEPLPQAPRGIRILRLDPGGELLDPRLARLGIQLPGGPKHRSGLIVEFLGQMADHIAHLVFPATLHQAGAPEDLAYGRA